MIQEKRNEKKKIKTEVTSEEKKKHSNEKKTK